MSGKAQKVIKVNQLNQKILKGKKNSRGNIREQMIGIFKIGYKRFRI